MILAGGYATRLYPLTKDFPKPLLEVKGKPIIEYIVKDLDRLDNVNKIVISTNKKFESHFSNWIKNLSEIKKEVVLEVENTYDEKEKLGAIKSLEQIYEKYSDDFLIVGGDNIFEDDLTGIIEKFKTKNTPIIGLCKSKNDHDSSQFGTVILDNAGYVTEFFEKSSYPKSELISACLYALPQSSLSKLNSYLKGNNSDSPGHFIRWLSKNESVYGTILTGSWWDIGTIDAYERVKTSQLKIKSYA